MDLESKGVYMKWSTSAQSAVKEQENVEAFGRSTRASEEKLNREIDRYD